MTSGGRLQRFIQVAVLRTLVVVALAVGVGCGPVERCTDDSQCNAFGESAWTCQTDLGVCLCKDDTACSGDHEFCNAAGRCQPLSGCDSNDDCQLQGDTAGGLFCDTTTSQCLSVAECDPDEGELCCSIDGHCPFNFVCGGVDNKCIPGCFDPGDCMLGHGCVGLTLQGGLGSCVEGACTRTAQCGFGELCNLETQSCVPDVRGPYCEACANSGETDECGGGGSYCLVDQTDPTGQSYFCGVDCTQGQPCPFGYGCIDVVIIPQGETCGREICTGAGTCSQSITAGCTVDEDCPFGGPGGTCPRAITGNCVDDVTKPCDQDGDCCEGGDCPPGSCATQLCVGGEAAAVGYCTCTKDSDCFRDQCDDADLSDPANPVPGQCNLSGHACFEDLDCDVIACVNGGCLLGSNCAPANDRSCRDLQ